MTSVDANVLLAAILPCQPLHSLARQCFESLLANGNVILAEQTLMETYGLLRNPVIQENPLTAPEAVSAIQAIRGNPRLIVVDVPQDRSIMDETWRIAAQSGFARRRIYDVRLARTLRHWGVDTFYTRNVGDFQDAGFAQLVNPFE